MTAPFMAEDIPDGPPRVTLDDMRPGSPAVVIVPSYRRGSRTDPIHAVIVSAARVWCEVESTGGPHPQTWRLRLDTQTDGSTSTYAVRWRTPAQHEWHEALRSADAFLSDQGIHLGLGSRWNDPADRIELARLVWPHRRVTA